MARKRRKVDPTSRLGQQQKDILVWMAKNYSLHIGMEPPGNPDLATVLFLPWEPAAFLRESPTAGERAGLSTSLRKLAERGLIERTGSDLGHRTAWVAFTKQGRLLAEKLINEDFDPAEHDRAGERMNLDSRIDGLRLAAKLLNRLVLHEETHRRAQFVKQYVKPAEGEEYVPFMATDRLASEEGRALSAVAGALEDSLAQRLKLHGE
jgi:DNA-binding MarR family transcriptional regulator